jgi:hypothetical protein
LTRSSRIIDGGDVKLLPLGDEVRLLSLVGVGVGEPGIVGKPGVDGKPSVGEPGVGGKPGVGEPGVGEPSVDVKPGVDGETGVNG